MFRASYTTKSIGDGFVLKTLNDLKWERVKPQLEMAKLKRKYGDGSRQNVYYYSKKLKIYV